MHQNLYTASMYVGPTAVRQWANRARLFFPNCLIFEGTERVWIRGIKAPSIYSVEADMRILFPPNRGFRTGLLLQRED